MKNNYCIYPLTPKRFPKKSSMQRAKYQLPGAVFAAAAWMIFSGIFSVYVDKYNNYSSFYGTMTTIALIMVWLYGCMYVLFIGGIINRTWEERMEAKKYYK